MQQTSPNQFEVIGVGCCQLVSRLEAVPLIGHLLGPIERGFAGAQPGRDLLLFCRAEPFGE